MMNTIKQIVRADESGKLKIELPVGIANAEVEYVIVYRVQTPEAAREEWLEFVNRTAGSLADDPMEEITSLPPEAREPIE